MALYWRDLARLYPRAKVLYCTVLYCTVLYPLDKVVLTVRDPAKWHLSVTSTIKTKMDWMANSWLGLPLRWFASLKGRYANAFYRQEIFFKVKIFFRHGHYDSRQVHVRGGHLPGRPLPSGHLRRRGERRGDRGQVLPRVERPGADVKISDVNEKILFTGYKGNSR